MNAMKPTRGRGWTRRVGIGALAALLLAGPLPRTRGDDVIIGERPALEHHVDQKDIDSGKLGLRELFKDGQLLFDAKFNRLDGQGRPGSTGAGVPRGAKQPAFIRTSGPDSNSCMGCHSDPRSGGALDVRDSNERNTLGMMGAGPIEMLAREMTAELIATREATAKEARACGHGVRRPLSAKGVSFGTILVEPDGRVDPRGIEGVDWDLVVKPFHQKGAVVSLRDFSNTAMNHHHGMQSVERFGAGVDPDGDGVRGNHRKVHQPLSEDASYSSGDGFHAFDTPVGRMAVLSDPQGAVFSIIKTAPQG